MQLVLFEDSLQDRFGPLTTLRSAPFLRAGILPRYEAIPRLLGQTSLPALAIRTDLGPVTTEEHPHLAVNIIKRSEPAILFVNARLRTPGDLIAQCRAARLMTRFADAQGETVAVLFPEKTCDTVPVVAVPQMYQALTESSPDEFRTIETTATLYRYPWELMADTGRAVADEFSSLASSLGPSRGVFQPGAHQFGGHPCWLGDGTAVLPGAVLDTTDGPVHVGANVRIEPHAYIAGPCHIGDNGIVLAGKIVHSSLGPLCRVGGEVEESIFHHAVNKYHAGFIGHSIVGSWVNFGAMTTNSDLKNNYSTIRVTMNGETIDTGSIKVGSIIGDHVKFGIGTLLNTGITIGCGCNVFGGSLVTDKEIPRLSWGATGSWERFDYAKFLETARRTMGRRGSTVSERLESVFAKLAAGQLTNSGVIDWPATT